MPYSIRKDKACPVSKPWAVVKSEDGKLIGCHETQADAQKQHMALMASASVEEHDRAIRRGS